ncbi:MAG: antibiotic biosynthesis monooxygenase [Kofleriaceae bacterium]
MVIVLIRTKHRPDANLAAYEALGAEMYALVQQIPGFIAADEFKGDDGSLGVVRFETLDALKVWREHPLHAPVMQRGRAEFYASYTIEVCETVRVYTRETSVLA